MLLVLLGFLVWSGVIHSGYVALDTPWLVINNPILSQGSYNQLGTIFTDISLGTRQTLGAEYLPIRDLSVLVDFALFDSWLPGHHAHSLVLYLASCCILLSCSMEMFGRSTHVWLLVLLYTWMPVHVENVVWLASRKDVLSMFWGLLAVWMYLKSSKPMLFATLCCICAYWSKNTSIVIPVILVGISIVQKKEDWRRVSWWIQWFPLLIVHGVMLWNTIRVGSQMGMFSEPRAETVQGVWSISAQVWWHYLHSMLLPFSLSAYYVEPRAEWNLITLLGTALIFISALAPLFYRKPAVALGLVWFFWGLLPVSQIAPIQNLIADRYLLFPSIAFVWIGVYFFRKSHHLWFLMGMSVFFAMHTYMRIPVWHGSIPFWKDLTEKQPSLVIGWVRLAGQYTDEGQWDRAESVLRAGQSQVSSNEDRAQIHQGLGLLAYRKKEYTQAELMLELALYEDDSLRKAQNNLVQVYRKLNKKEKAYKTALSLCEQHPLYDVGWNTLGVMELERGHLRAAQEAFVRSLDIHPYSSSVWVNMGNVAFLAEDYDVAQYWWERVLQEGEHEHARAGLAEIARIKGGDQ